MFTVLRVTLSVVMICLLLACTYLLYREVNGRDMKFLSLDTSVALRYLASAYFCTAVFCTVLALCALDIISVMANLFIAYGAYSIYGRKAVLGTISDLAHGIRNRFSGKGGKGGKGDSA